PMLKERVHTTISGGMMVLGLIAATLGSGWAFVQGAQPGDAGSPVLVVIGAIGMVLVALGLTAFFVVSPNEARVLQFFGKYIGTVKEPGFHWTWPFVMKRAVSIRVRNFDSAQIKVNDHDGNPIEIAAVVVWRVADTAEAVFQVDNYENFLRVQTEAAIRNLA